MAILCIHPNHHRKSDICAILFFFPFVLAKKKRNGFTPFFFSFLFFIFCNITEELIQLFDKCINNSCIYLFLIVFVSAT